MTLPTERILMRPGNTHVSWFDLLRRAYGSIAGVAFELTDVDRQLRLDGGLDYADVAFESLERAFSNPSALTSTELAALRFACEELMAYYEALGPRASRSQLAATLFVSFLLAELHRRDPTGWETEWFRKIFWAAARWSRYVEEDDLYEFFMIICRKLGPDTEEREA